MTIRGGAGPRGGDEPGRERPPMARPIDATGSSGSSGARRPARRAGTVTAYDMARQRPASGIGGILRFLVFLVIAAAIVLVALGTVLRPVTRGLVVGWADANPGALGVPFVADFVREDLGEALTAPASSDATEVDFTVESGETAAGIAARLVDAGVLRDQRAFLLIAIEKGLTDQLDTGTFLLRRNLTPDQLVATLLEAKDPSITIQFRTGLRLEQMTAYLEARPDEIATLQLDAADFLALVRKPPKALLDDYPWLDLPKGATLEGYLAAGAYRVLPDTTPDELVRKMLDHFAEEVGPARIQAAKDNGILVPRGADPGLAGRARDEPRCREAPRGRRVPGPRRPRHDAERRPERHLGRRLVGPGRPRAREVAAVLLLERAVGAARIDRVPEVDRGLPDLPGRRE